MTSLINCWKPTRIVYCGRFIHQTLQITKQIITKMICTLWVHIEITHGTHSMQIISIRVVINVHPENTFLLYSWWNHKWTSSWSRPNILFCFLINYAALATSYFFTLGINGSVCPKLNLWHGILWQADVRHRSLIKLIHSLYLDLDPQFVLWLQRHEDRHKMEVS